MNVDFIVQVTWPFNIQHKCWSKTLYYQLCIARQVTFPYVHTYRRYGLHRRSLSVLTGSLFETSSVYVRRNHTYIGLYTRTHTHTHTHTATHARTHTHARARTHARTHTATQRHHMDRQSHPQTAKNLALNQAEGTTVPVDRTAVQSLLTALKYSLISYVVRSAQMAGNQLPWEPTLIL